MLLFCVAFEQEQGISVLTDAIKACTAEIEKYKGKLLVKEPPRAVSSFQYLLILLYSHSKHASLHVHVLKPKAVDTLWKNRLASGKTSYSSTRLILLWSKMQRSMVTLTVKRRKIQEWAMLILQILASLLTKATLVDLDEICCIAPAKI